MRSDVYCAVDPMFESPEPLTRFFGEMLPAARFAGYKLVLTLLAREADSDGIFRDVERYWSSLHDVTGDHVLFVLGARAAGRKFPHTGMPERREPVMHSSPNMAVSGKRTVYWHGESRPIAHLWDSLLRGHEDPSENLARSHSMEITSLRHHLGLDENCIPALLVMPLDGHRIVVAFARFEGITIYSYIKELVGSLDHLFTRLDITSVRLKDLRSSLRKIETRESRAKWSLWGTDSEIKALRSSREAAEQISLICKAEGAKSGGDKRKCFELLQAVIAEQGSHSSVVMRLQSMIDRSSHRGSAQWKVAEGRKQDVIRSIQEAETEERASWKEIHVALDGLVARKRADSGSAPWDFFIAYSAKDYWYADRLYEVLSRHGRVFLDRLCLRPGDIWPERLRSEQDNARSTIVLITENSDKAWFANSEYVHAIDLVRHKSHRILPILIGNNAALPYGLEQVQAIKHDTGGDFRSTGDQLLGALNV